MTKHSENENFLLYAFLLRQTKISQEINIFALSSYNCLLAKGINRFQLSLVKKRQK